MGISWKWSHHAQKVLAPPVCLIKFGCFISLYPGWFGSCSSWQSCRTRLVLQLCQLHHLLIRHGLGVNHRRSSSVSRASQLWMDAVLVDVADRRQHIGDIWRPYAVSGPARQSQARAWPPWRRPEQVDASISSPLLFSRRKLGRSGVAVASSFRRARARSTLHRRPPKLAHSSAVTYSRTSTLKLVVKPSGEPTFPTFPKSGCRDRFLRRAQCRAPRSISSSLVRF